jgi:hypothetical protein
MKLMTIGLVLAGAGGGLLRGVWGIAKEMVSKKSPEINWLWFGLTVAISAIIGVIAASFFGEDLRLALLAGYVGADFIEGLMKIKLNKMFEEKEETKKTGSVEKLLEKMKK